MFEVHARYRLEFYPGKDDPVIRAAGRLPVFNGNGEEWRLFRWAVIEFADALEMRKRLARIRGVIATFHERVSKVKR